MRDKTATLVDEYAFEADVWSKEALDAGNRAMRAFRGLPPLDAYLPIPWYGRLRNWLSNRVGWFGEHVVQRAEMALWYDAKLKSGTDLPKTPRGTSVTFTPWEMR